MLCSKLIRSEHDMTRAIKSLDRLSKITNFLQYFHGNGSINDRLNVQPPYIFHLTKSGPLSNKVWTPDLDTH